MSAHTPEPWGLSTCQAPMWMGGSPAGVCNEIAYGHQLPELYLKEMRGLQWPPYCFGHACSKHGGPQEKETRIFQDGLTNEGRRMWCAVNPDFINLQESSAGFDGNPFTAVSKLRKAIAKATGGAA